MINKEYILRCIFDFEIDKNNCWNVTSHSKKKDGYISATLKGVNGGHRIAYKLFNKDFDTKKVIRHKCDNPSCINPEHLEMGTTQDNVNDMMDRGRHKYISRKLTVQNVIDIFISDKSSYELAEIYDVTPVQIRRIHNGTRWNKITKDFKRPINKKIKQPIKTIKNKKYKPKETIEKEIISASDRAKKQWANPDIRKTMINKMKGERKISRGSRGSDYMTYIDKLLFDNNIRPRDYKWLEGFSIRYRNVNSSYSWKGNPTDKIIKYCLRIIDELNVDVDLDKAVSEYLERI